MSTKTGSQAVAADVFSPGSASSPGMTALQLTRSPYSASVLLRTLLLSSVVLLVGLLLVPWQQNLTGSGRVVAYAPVDRQQNIEAPIEGRVVKFYIREGSHVKPGDPIADIADNDPALLLRLREERDAVRDRLEAARARASSLDDRIAALSGSRRSAVSAAGSRTRMAKERVLAAEQAVAATQAMEKTAQLNLQRQQALYAKGLSSSRALELSDLEAVRTRTEVDRASASLAAARNEESALRSDYARIGTDASALLEDARANRATALAEIANATAELARIEVRLARQSMQSVKSTTTGTILRLVGGLGGEMVKAGDSLAVVVPDTDARAAELWVDGNDMPLLSEGQHVRLQFEGWPAVQFVGWPSVAVGTFPAKVALIDATDNGKGKFRILAVPDEDAERTDPRSRWPSKAYLRQGVRVHGWVLLSRVRLGYELWRQFNGFPPVIAKTEPGDEKGKSDGKTQGGK